MKVQFLFHQQGFGISHSRKKKEYERKIGTYINKRTDTNLCIHIVRLMEIVYVHPKQTVHARAVVYNVRNLFIYNYLIVYAKQVYRYYFDIIIDKLKIIS